MYRRRRRNSVGQNISRYDILENLGDLQEIVENLMEVIGSAQDSLAYVEHVSYDYAEEFIAPKLRSIRLLSENAKSLATQTEALVPNSPRHNPSYYIEDYDDEY